MKAEVQYKVCLIQTPAVFGDVQVRAGWKRPIVFEGYFEKQYFFQKFPTTSFGCFENQIFFSNQILVNLPFFAGNRNFLPQTRHF